MEYGGAKWVMVQDPPFPLAIWNFFHGGEGRRLFSLQLRCQVEVFGFV